MKHRINVSADTLKPGQNWIPLNLDLEAGDEIEVTVQGEERPLEERAFRFGNYRGKIDGLHLNIPERHPVQTDCTVID